MGKDVADESPAARELFDQAKDVLGYDLIDVCTNGPAEKLNRTDVSQPAIFVCSLAALEKLKSSEANDLEGVVGTAGLSLGEYTALVFAGAMTYLDALKVVKARGEAMQAAAEAKAGGMVSVIGLSVEEVETLVAEAKSAGPVQVANLLAPGNTVVSGSAAGIDEVCRLAEASRLRTVRLDVAGAFHTEMMKPADAKLAEALDQVEIRPARIPIWSNVDALPHTKPEEFRELLVRQVLSPVRWEDTMRAMLGDGIQRFYEIGPGKVLAGLLKRVDRKVDIRNIPG